MTLLDAKEYDEQRARKRNIRIIWITAGILILLAVGWWFRYWPEERIVGRFFDSLQKKDYDAADNTVSEIEKLLPEEQRAGLGQVRFRILLAKGDYAGATKMAGQVSDANKDNAMLQNQIAWTMLTDKSIKPSSTRSRVGIGRR